VSPAGLLLVAGAALCYNLGVVLQAVEIRRAPSLAALDPRIFVRLVRAPRWLVGAGLNLLGWVLQAWAVTLLPLSVVQPGLAVGFVFLFALSHFVLGEPVGAREWTSGAILVGGILLVASAAPPPGPPAGDARAWALAGAPLAAAMLAPYAWRALGRGPRWVSLGISTGAAYALTGIGTALGARLLVEDRLPLALATGAVIAAVGALGFLSETSALRSGRATAVLPLLTAIDTIVPVAVAPALFHEAWGSPHGGLAFGGGLLLAAAGIAGLTTSSRLPVADVAAGAEGTPGEATAFP
jgi:drug/metabolite transporter (DMT)-like permease